MFKSLVCSAKQTTIVQLFVVPILFYYLPILKTVVPHLGHTPFVAGRLFFKVTLAGFLISTFALHLKQYADGIGITSFRTS